MATNYFQYLRKEKMPHIWCAGCVHGQIVKSIIRAIDKLGMRKNDEVAVVSGIGCSSWTPGTSISTPSTRPTEVSRFRDGKSCEAHLNGHVVGGDGDMMAIGQSFHPRLQGGTSTSSWSSTTIIYTA